MKQFILKVVAYMLVILLIWNAIAMLRISSGQYEKSVDGSEVYCAIYKSKTKKKVKRLIMGDSVGNQLYPCNQDLDSFVSLACNQAITLGGQYFLLKNFIETNKDALPDEVILLITPFSLSNDVSKYAYQYFLKPFPPSKYSVFYTEHLSQRIRSIPLYWTANLPFIQTSNYTPQWVMASSQQEPKSVSQLSYEYLLKMDSIANANSIVFRMVSTPIREDRRNEIASFWENLPTEYLSRLSKLLQPYKESVKYLPSEWYQDPAHFVEVKIPNDYLNLLSK